MAAVPSNQSQNAQTSNNPPGPPQPSKAKEPDDPVTKLKSSIPLLKEVITVCLNTESYSNMWIG